MAGRSPPDRIRFEFKSICCVQRTVSQRPCRYPSDAYVSLSGARRVAVAEIVAGLVEVGLEAIVSAFRSRRKAPSQPLPTDPTKLEFFGLISGSMLILASFAGYAVHLY